MPEVPAVVETLHKVLSSRCIFVCGGEGAHSADSDISALKHSPSWPAVSETLEDLKIHWSSLGQHEAPASPVLSVALAILCADLWRSWNLQPSVVLGHSVGEVAAAYVAGIYDVREALLVAHGLKAAKGVMLHTELVRKELSGFPKAEMHLAAVNHVVKKGSSEDEDVLSVTLCGPRAEEYLELDPKAMKLRPLHAWHHPEAPLPGPLPVGKRAKLPFISAVSGLVAELSEDHWSLWARTPVRFLEALEAAKDGPAVVIEMGAHATFAAAVQATFGADLLGYASSMCRGESTAEHLRQQRALLPGFRDCLGGALEDFSFNGSVLSHSASFSEQGITSQQLVLLSERLRPFFPKLAAHDLYRFTSIERLLEWKEELPSLRAPSLGRRGLAIMGCALRLPGADSPGDFWAMLAADDQRTAFASERRPVAAYLEPQFDVSAALKVLAEHGLEGREAAAMDPQHAFALLLAKEMWHDVGQVEMDQSRVGVYIGAWQAASTPATSAYAVLGESLSCLAPRVANAYNLQGPTMTVNTACSSALVALHQAMSDHRSDVVDFAVAGGVNLFGEDQHLFQNLRRAGMLSPTGRCHTFSAKADGYVRGEGGGLFFLGGLPGHAQLEGSAVAQNGKQRPLTAVDPLAQERVLRAAQAGCKADLVEMHGTGTPLGDPVEVSVLARVGCRLMTASKMHVGHLESAAGAVGLVKAMLICERRWVPGFRVEDLNPEVLKAMEGSSLQLPGLEAEFRGAVGVSSFGFAGSNAHVVVAASQRPCEPYGVVAVKQLSGQDMVLEPCGAAAAVAVERVERPSGCALSEVQALVSSILGTQVDVDADLQEMGLDSLGMAELLGSLEDHFGGVPVDAIMAQPRCRAIAEALAAGCEAEMPWGEVRPETVPEETAPEVRKEARWVKEKSEDVEGHEFFRTTHVGSLPRPDDLEGVIGEQVEAGLHVINDGEWLRENYVADVVGRIRGLQGSKVHGYECCEPMPVAADMYDVPIYAQRFTGGNGLITLNPKRCARSGLACIGHPVYRRGNLGLSAFLDAASKAGKRAKDCFFSVPSPGTLALFCRDEFFHDHKAYVSALATALKEEYQEIVQHGLLLQVDCPDLAMGRHTRWAELSEEEFLEIATMNVEALNLALQDVPLEQIRVHVCWGNYAGPHHKDVSVDRLWPVLSLLKAKYILMEGANARHRIDVAAFERAVQKGYFHGHQIICPGVIDTTTARVEDPQLICETLLRYSRCLQHRPRVMASTDCGFESTKGSVAITGDVAWLKLRSLVEGARRATQHLLELASPVACRAMTMAVPLRAVLFVRREAEAVGLRELLEELTRRPVTVLPEAMAVEEAFEALRWIVDAPLVLVAMGAAPLAQATLERLSGDGLVARRPCSKIDLDGPLEVATEQLKSSMSSLMASWSFDKRSLLLPRSAVPSKVDVVVVGAGLLGMLSAHRCRAAGFSVAVLEQRAVVGGIWSMYANGTSQVNSSEGGYCIKELLDEETWDNRDHSMAAEVLTDLAKLGKQLEDQIFTSVRVVKILGEKGSYTVLFDDALAGRAEVVHCRGVVLCINDRVGLPRPLDVPCKGFKGLVADGTADSLAAVQWPGKRVVVVGMGAFAVENARTALEHGAKEVVVVARRHGTICPKAIDYLNFVKPWDSKFKHDSQTNVKQFLRWKQLYESSSCTIPECWPKQVKHEGHTISVSDLWFVAHFLKKLRTAVGEVQEISEDGVRLTSGECIACDVVVGCIGFERSSLLCETLTGRSVVRTTNYLDQDMMYLADAEIDEGAFNSFFGSSVLEYGKFFTNVFVEGLKRPELAESLWGSETEVVPVTQRKWNQYIASAAKLIEEDPAIAEHARHQVKARQEHFWRTLPPQSFLAVNRREWQELHTVLNGGVPLPEEQQLPYFFEEIPEWC